MGIEGIGVGSRKQIAMKFPRTTEGLLRFPVGLSAHLKKKNSFREFCFPRESDPLKLEDLRCATPDNRPAHRLSRLPSCGPSLETAVVPFHSKAQERMGTGRDEESDGEEDYGLIGETGESASESIITTS